ncbi:hypothetical protein MYCTH_2298331 [Thermothelomyces thermophilus ATCC 42464]|uniref:Uncharacterized protein n=1 Tax=Thermothelomyces thermophilus (strain ATCC 42464 / BCRC 31852 / DSM 1799) TaxID=573729 RepID=G2Q1L3_THET4|nr:uncharacterized protein MYCTH_2298331 [Thermothelomyces thermophilus ATCC 42464]AEO55004.1 hypothetical protein MYCTH_2298331 [Thermothelomyces thermophilus ATCC 42464]
MAVQGHLFHFELQSPPFMPSVFCQPVGIGGPQGPGLLDFPVWPILVPAADGFRVCYTDDEDFRDAYLARGFCGLDAAFRDQFDHDCHRQAVHVAPTVREEKLGRPKQTSQDGGSQKGKSRSSRNDQEESMLQTMFEPFSVFDYLSLPVPRFFMNAVRLVRPYVDKLTRCTLTLFGVMCYISFLAMPVIALALLAVTGIVGAVILSLENLGLIKPGTLDPPNPGKRVPATAKISAAAATTSPIPRPRVAAAAAADPTMATTTRRAATANHKDIYKDNYDDDVVGKEEPFELVPRMSSAKAASSEADESGIATVETLRRRLQQRKLQQQQQQQQQQRNVRIFAPGYSPHGWDRVDSDDEDEDEDEDDEDGTSGRATPPSWSSFAAEA